MANDKPKKLGKYKIVEEIGRGGFGTVYKALDTSLGDRVVAIKVLAPYALQDPEFVTRFHQEAQVTAKLRHRNIVVIHEAAEADGAHYLAMELLEGKDLAHIIAERGALPLPEVNNLLEQIASALDYAHSRDLVHRDVKPSNIIVDDEGHATLTDFGIVKAAEGTHFSSMGRQIGTPEYMSPEQATSEGVDWRTDLYALGVVAYEMCTGSVPFHGDTPTSTLFLHVYEQPPDPIKLKSDLPPEVRQVLLKALAKDREERYQTAGALVEAFGKAMSSAGGPPQAVKEGRTWPRNVLIGVPVALMMLVAVCALVCAITLAPQLVPLFVTTPTSMPMQTPISQPQCGDGLCSGAESAETCPQDCAAPAPGETPAVPPPAETAGPAGPFEANVDALNNLASYAYTFHFEGLSTTSGTVEHSVLDINGQRQNQPTRSEQLSFASSDGQSTTTEFVYIQDQNKMWTREGGGEWTEIEVFDQSMVSIFDAFSMGFWWTTLFGTSGQEARLVGQEMVGGVLANHYQTVEGTSYLFSVGCNWGSSHDDAWVAVDGNYPVKRQLDASGDCQGQSGEVHFSMEITNINQPVSISPPM